MDFVSSHLHPSASFSAATASVEVRPRVFNGPWSPSLPVRRTPFHASPNDNRAIPSLLKNLLHRINPLVIRILLNTSFEAKNRLLETDS